jgi:hypothetical protein
MQTESKAANRIPVEGETIQRVLPHNYRTVQCKFWEQGQCRMGDECNFAHDTPAPIPSAAFGDRTEQTEENDFLVQMQLSDIADGLQQYYSNNRMIFQKLKTARDFTEFGNYEAAGDILTVLYHKSKGTHSGLANNV